MDRKQFMRQLEALLSDIPGEERREALEYYESYFDEAGEDREAEVIKELGSPGKVAAIIKADLQENGYRHGEYAENGYEEEGFREKEETPEQKTRTQTVVLDPGHSSVVASGTEPLGPGSTENKAADTSGTSGTVSGLTEYELNLTVSQKLRTELQNRGYTVLMTRESNDVPVSCIERADVANNSDADAFVRIHANGSEDSSAKGAMTICITPDNPFYPALYEQARALSDCIINNLSEVTGCENDGVWETDSMSGNNWSQVPATIVEMGYMTNPDEDALMATDDYQNKIVKGIADGIDQYFGYR